MKLKDIQVLNEKETRGGFGEGIHEIGKENPNVVVLTADLAGSLKLGPFIKDFPDRFVQVGIAEANMIGIAAGMTIGGKIPYTTTFALSAFSSILTADIDMEAVEVGVLSKEYNSFVYVFHCPFTNCNVAKRSITSSSKSVKNIRIKRIDLKSRIPPIAV